LIKIVVGFDQREAIAYHTFCQSVIDKSSIPVSFIPLKLEHIKEYTEFHEDGSNSFIYSRFLTPFLCDYEGWAIFADGDMICLEDINKLWDLRDDSKAVMVVKHDYKTKSNKKYLGNVNEDYPRKNWSSVILWNCGHEMNLCLTPEYLMGKTGKHLHRFEWLSDGLIGEIPKEWNWLVTEYPENHSASLLHYTLGTPCFPEYYNCEMSEYWHKNNLRANEGKPKTT